MRKVSRYIGILLFLILLVNGTKVVYDIKKADELFEKGVFQEALKEYNTVFEKNKRCQEN